MIGEPEIDGVWDTDVPEREALPDGLRERERVRGPRAPWRWALGGVVVASAVWAGALVVQDRFAATPRIDYRHSDDLCKEVGLTVLGQTVGRPFEGSESSQGTSPAQDWAHCRTGMRWEEDVVSYWVQTTVELHKEQDPAGEFATGPGAASPGSRLDPDGRREVPGLGGRAVLDRYASGNGERLMVLDGGAVLTMAVEWFPQGDPDQTSGVDADAVDAAMIEDMRTLMAKLRR